MTFHTTLSLVASSASGNCPTFRYFVGPSNIFSCCFPYLHFPSIIPVVTQCSNFSLLITWPKKIVFRLRSLFMSDLVASFSHNAVSFDFFTDHDIRSIFLRNHIYVASSIFSNCFEIVQASIHQNGSM